MPSSTPSPVCRISLVEPAAVKQTVFQGKGVIAESRQGKTYSGWQDLLVVAFVKVRYNQDVLGVALSVYNECDKEMTMDLRNMLLDIHALEEEMLDFERKYGIRSETLYAAYVNGEEPENDHWVLDFGEWASIYKTWLTRQAEYCNEVQRRQRNATSLRGLIQVAAT